MEERSVFFEEWLRSLREQYKHVVVQNDRVNLSSLTAVMSEVGFSADELAQLRVEATMHVDKVGADHVADMEILEHTLPHAAECLCPVCAATDEAPSEVDEQPLPINPEQEALEPKSVLPAAALEYAETNETNDTSEANDEPAPLTFEDSLAAQESEASDTDASDNPDPVEARDGDEDADNPLQMSLF